MASSLMILEVHLYGKAIGTLTHFPGEQTLFAFTQDYIDDVNRPALSLSFKSRFGALITDTPPTRTRVPPFFANLLPEGPLREYLAQRARVHSQREFFLLAVLGEDLPGAITLTSPEGQSFAVDGEHGADGRNSEAANRDHALRFSLAGVQLKFSAVMGATGGLTVPASGVGGSWILKLPSTRFAGVPENEYTMMTLARAIGIDVPEVALVNLKGVAGLPPEMSNLGGQALAVRRFDRGPDGKRFHIEDFAQVFGVYPEDKYAKASYRNIAEVIWAETGEEGIAEFIRRLVFNALIGNADMHLKNWSLIYPDRRSAVLAPGYDFVATIAYLDDANMALKFGKSKNMFALSRETLQYFAAKARLPERLVLDAAGETVNRFLATWEQERKHVPLPKEAIETVARHFQKIAIVGETKKA